MATDVKTKLLTAEEFMAADLGDGTFELVRGEVIQVPPPMPEHGLVCVNIVVALWNYGTRTGHGYPIVQRLGSRDRAGTGYCAWGGHFFYSHERWPRSQVGSTLPPVPPDLVVEVYSPGNRRGKIAREGGQSTLMRGYPWSGSSIPRAAPVVIYRSADEPPDVLKQDAVIENLPELPGFRCPVADFFL